MKTLPNIAFLADAACYALRAARQNAHVRRLKDLSAMHLSVPH
jgi:hypothetical protein